MLRHQHKLQALTVLTVLTVVIGTNFYRTIEGMSTVDALYFSVITLTTVGYGDIFPVTDAGKLFTVVYVLVGIGILIAFIDAISSKIVARHHSNED